MPKTVKQTMATRSFLPLLILLMEPIEEEWNDFKVISISWTWVRVNCKRFGKWPIRNIAR